MGNGSFKSSSLVPGYVSMFVVLTWFKCLLVLLCWLLLIGSIKDGIYLGPPPKEKLPKVHCYPLSTFQILPLTVVTTIVKFLQNSPQGSLLLGAISYGKLSFAGQGENKNPEKHPASYHISYIVPPNKVTLCLIKLPAFISCCMLYEVNCTSHTPKWLFWAS